MMELIKTHGLRPGTNLFFYRDQNGVEIDFVVEQKGTLYLIEAKAGERIPPGKLHFNRVAPLFRKTFKTENILALNIKEDKVLRQKEYAFLNPLYSEISL